MKKNCKTCEIRNTIYSFIGYMPTKTLFDYYDQRQRTFIFPASDIEQILKLHSVDDLLMSNESSDLSWKYLKSTNELQIRCVYYEFIINEAEI